MFKLNKVNGFFFCFFLYFNILGQEVYPISTQLMDKDYRAFDFWIGEWRVELNRIEAFEQHQLAKATAFIYPVLDGRAVLEIWNEDDKQDTIGLRGFSLRYFDRKENKWHLILNWARKGFSRTVFFEGEFEDHRAIFNNSILLPDSTRRHVKYLFTDIGKNYLRWEDQYSSDEGHSWSSNWVMNFQRNKDYPEWPQINQFANFASGSAFPEEEFLFLRNFAGGWKAEIENADVSKMTTANVTSYLTLDGGGVLFFITYDSIKKDKELMFLTYNTILNQYELVSLGNDKKSKHKVFRGLREGETLNLIMEGGEEKFLLSIKNGVMVFQNITLLKKK